MKILFVCTGNTCRSPLAEAIARKIAISATVLALVTLLGRGRVPFGVLRVVSWPGYLWLAVLLNKNIRFKSFLLSSSASHKPRKNFNTLATVV